MQTIFKIANSKTGVVHLRHGTIEQAKGTRRSLDALLRLMRIEGAANRSAEIKAETQLTLPSCNDHTFSNFLDI